VSSAWLKRVIGFGVAAAVLTFVVLKLRSMDWPAVADALAGYGTTAVLAAVGLALPAILACAAYDLIGRHATGHRLSVARTMLISFTGYFVSLNLGAIVGGLALRFRLYMPYDLKTATIAQVIALSILTNWSGFAVIAGIALLFGSPELVGRFGMATGLMRGLGVLCILIALGYFLACHFKGGQRLRLRKTEIRLPTSQVAAVQLALACTNWAFMGAIIAWLLPEVGWFSIMPVLMASAVAGIWSHVPGGIGVTESVFVTLLAGQAPEAQILAAVLLFRFIYYLIPLALALSAYAYLELTANRARKPVGVAGG
jgi:hypothetical protein